jgi:hypothetical protein
LLHNVGLALSYRGDVGYLPSFFVEPEDLALENSLAVDVCRFLHSCIVFSGTKRSRLLMVIIISSFVAYVERLLEHLAQLEGIVTSAAVGADGAVDDFIDGHGEHRHATSEWQVVGGEAVSDGSGKVVAELLYA